PAVVHPNSPPGLARNQSFLSFGAYPGGPKQRVGERPMRHLGPLATARICIFFVFLILPVGASAQVQNGEITGTVADPSGAVVPGAKIVLQNVGTRYEIHVQTNNEGTYSGKELTVGAYLVRVEA